MLVPAKPLLDAAVECQDTGPCSEAKAKAWAEKLASDVCEAGD